MEELKTKKLGARNWVVIWLAGMVGQLAWNVENQWFNTFIYAKIAPNPTIISVMVAVSATLSTIFALFFGTLGDRMGKRKPLVVWGYILWGVTTILFGLSEFVAGVTRDVFVLGAIVVFADGIMSIFGTMGNDAGFNPWTTDITTKENRGALGAVVAIQPVVATIVGTLIGGMIIEKWDYLAFFIIFGIFFIVTGVICQFIMKDADSLKPTVEDSFWQQFSKAFNFKLLGKNKMLLLVLSVFCVFFVSFNVYFPHMLNLFIYEFGFNEGDAGIFMGVGLLAATPMTIISARFINKRNFVRSTIVAIVVNAAGLLVMLLTTPAKAAGLMSLKVTIIIGTLLVGGGYMMFYQTLMMWCKNLYPDEQRGQLEGVRLFFYVMLPMIFGPLIANPIVKKMGKEITLEYPLGNITGHAPTVSLFLAAFVVVMFTAIPLYFAWREGKKRGFEDAGAEELIFEESHLAEDESIS
jgi:Major Facilitator Superfamily.